MKKLIEYPTQKVCDNCGYRASITPTSGDCFVCDKGKFIRAHLIPAPVAAACDAVVIAAEAVASDAGWPYVPDFQKPGCDKRCVFCGLQVAFLDTKHDEGCVAAALSDALAALAKARGAES